MIGIVGIVEDVVHGVTAFVQRAEHLLGADEDVVLHGFTRRIQLDGYSCGAQSTFSILRYFGRARSIERTKTLLGTDEDGTAWPSMRRLLNARGLVTKTIAAARKRDLKGAIDRDAPVVVSVDDEEHWAVVYGYGRDHVYLADPSLLGSVRVVVPWPTFMQRWGRWAGVVSRRARRGRSCSSL